MNHKYISILVIVTFFSLNAVASIDRWVVKNPKSLNADLSRNGFFVLDNFTLGNDSFLVLESTPDRNNLDVLVSLTGTPDVTPDFPIELEQPFSTSISDSKGAWHVSSMKYAALSEESDGRGVIVAVIDSGIDTKHPGFINKLWTNPGEIPGNKIDDDQNGYVDDVNGYSFSKKTGELIDTQGHGTHCAGIIVGAPEDSSPTSARGVAPGAKVMALQIFGPDNKLTFMSDAAQAIKYAVDNNAQVLSNSWRLYKSWKTYEPTPEKVELLGSAIRYAKDRGVIFVAAAGNENKDITSLTDPIYPIGLEGHSNLFVVAASNEKGTKASFTNFGPKKVHVAAPGDDITSSVPGGKWAQKSGTSMACPLVAGAIARGISLGMKGEDAVRNLKETSDVSGDWKTLVETGGVINLVKFLER